MKTYKEQQISNIVTAAIEEISGELEKHASGNYWITRNWNIYAEKVNTSIDSFIVIRLELYSDFDECVNSEFDVIDTMPLTNPKQELSFSEAMMYLVQRNYDIIFGAKESINSNKCQLCHSDFDESGSGGLWDLSAEICCKLFGYSDYADEQQDEVYGTLRSFILSQPYCPACGKKKSYM